MSACLCEFAICNEPLQYDVMCSAPVHSVPNWFLLCSFAGYTCAYLRRFVCGCGFGVNIMVYIHVQMKEFQWTGGLAVSTLFTHSLLLMTAYAIHSKLACFLWIPLQEMPPPFPSPPICCVRYARADRPCPNPTVSCYPSHKHFGAILERLRVEVKSFTEDKTICKATTTTKWVNWSQVTTSFYPSQKHSIMSNTSRAM